MEIANGWEQAVRNASNAAAKTSKKQSAKLVDVADDVGETEAAPQPEQGIEGNVEDDTRH